MWLPSFHSGTVQNHPAAGGGKLQHLGQRMRTTLFGEAATRCTICHAELVPDELSEGMCRDQSACCLRRYSQRCF